MLLLLGRVPRRRGHTQEGLSLRLSRELDHNWRHMPFKKTITLNFKSQSLVKHTSTRSLFCNFAFPIYRVRKIILLFCG